MSAHKILTINPGSTSTKIAVFAGEKLVHQTNLKHSVEELAPFKHITEQYDFRKSAILAELKSAGINLDEITAVVGRGGLIKPVPSGVIEVNEKLKHDLIHALKEHASNLGGLIADDIAKSLPSARAFIADPVVVDELSDVARISGHPNFERKSIFHALNQKAVARRYAREIGRKYEDLNLIVVHLGGGISVGAHLKGKVVDVNQALDGEGAFSPERSGTLPCGDLVEMCFSGKYNKAEIKKMLNGQGGFTAYLNTNDAREVQQMVEAGDAKAKLINDAMTYQVSKDIGAMATVLNCEVDAIIITGGIAHNKGFIADIKAKVSKLAPVTVYPGEDEMEALAFNGLLVLTGELVPMQYE